jgi:basic membrane protein A
MKYSNLIIKVLLVVLILSLGVTSGIAKAPSDYKMVLILPGPINDQSWNAANYNQLSEITVNVVTI